ncbi:MAG: coproporphyrinogen dehydrogenase HemZ [Oscillospiraceae bacterium]|nr:coproporphyrinogen dehydrogenase HemZ [Oscillospiraceae bacterium]
MTDHPYRYAAERIIRAFGIDVSNACFPIHEAVYKDIKLPKDGESKKEYCIRLYDRLSSITGIKLPWGSFTGVRPIKYIRDNRDIISDYRIAQDRLALADEIIAVQDKVLPVDKKRFSLYAGIPFCPSRCRYCSFVSESVIKSWRLIPRYTELIIKELKILAEYAAANELFLETIYVGGGTPTCLPSEHFQRLLLTVSDCFNLSGVKEYTIEAGRPETLTDDMLSIMKKAGATRISVNPQSMNDSVLKKIGRGHTSADTVSAFNAAVKTGFSSVNMDLIAGLPGENEEMFIDGINRITELSPDNITVHSLAHKKGTERIESGCSVELTQTAYDILKLRGYHPYYLYRLRESRGDNIGYTRDLSKMCLYNIYMMDESSTVLAAGCGGATRIFDKYGKMKKHYNFKYPYEYIERFDEVICKLDEGCGI